MKKISFKGINFYTGNFNQIKKKFDNGGVLVAPAASALANIENDNIYFSSLRNSNIAIFDSGFFCILIRIFKFKKVKKLSGFLFLKNFLDQYKKNDKLLLINPSKKSDALNYKYLRSIKIHNFKSYIAPKYKRKIVDPILLNLIKKFKPNTLL